MKPLRNFTFEDCVQLARIERLYRDPERWQKVGVKPDFIIANAAARQLLLIANKAMESA